MTQAMTESATARKERLFAEHRAGTLSFSTMADEVYKIDHPHHRLRVVVRLAAGVVLPLLFMGFTHNREDT